MKKTLKQIADIIQAELKGDPDCEISGIAVLSDAQSGDLSFFHNAKYRDQLKNTKAGAVIVSEKEAEHCNTNVLIAKDPYFALATIAKHFAYQSAAKPGIHPSAIVGEHCQIHNTASIAANVVIEDHVSIGASTRVEAGVIIGAHTTIGEDCELLANATINHHVIIGNRVSIFSGAVIGSDGFGNAMHQGQWHKVPQIGGVVIEDDVDIGANTTIDRGAIGDTRIGKGAKLDNQIQIGHNVQIGPHTAIAACVGIAGSAKVGAYCMIGGAACINGHIEVADKTIVTGMAMVTNSIKTPGGMYSSGTGFMDSASWRKNAVRFRQLDQIARRVKKLEEQS